MTRELFRSTFNQPTVELLLTALLVALLIFCDVAVFAHPGPQPSCASTGSAGRANYMNDAPVDIGVARSNSGDPRTPIKGVALPVLGVMAYVDHTWSKRWASSIGYSMLNISNSEGQLPDAFRRGHYASGNILFYPVDRAMVGSELIWGRRENFLDGFSSEDVHLQFSFKYNFSKELKF